MKIKTSIFRGYEIEADNIRMKEHLLYPGVDINSLDYSPVAYFKQYGFKVPRAISQLYARYNGIESDKYIPESLYFYYITPYLVNLNLSLSYVDKNMYYLLYPLVKQPETILHCAGSRFYLPKYEGEISRDEAGEIIAAQGDFVIKPSILSGCGRDVRLENGRCLGKDGINKILDLYKSDFIIQRPVVQHTEMARLNPSSLNTCRVYTYRPVSGGGVVLLGAGVRFGENGDFRDNASAGGGFCKIMPNGVVEDKIYRFCNINHMSLEIAKGLIHFRIPNYDMVVGVCVDLHKKIPYLDLIGWDIAIGVGGEPVLVELNQYADAEFLQVLNGPMFGEYTDDLIGRISHSKLEGKVGYKRSFDNAPEHYAYTFEMGKKYSI